ncbi:protein ITPRID1 isoform X2 [Erpetoichthys calabaricus]|nr:protein ITPRID1 isoform X2 [Erpetoichthys calabaricus]
MNETDDQQHTHPSVNDMTRGYTEENIQKWILSGRDANNDTLQNSDQTGGHLNRLCSTEDDLQLGVEACVYSSEEIQITINENISYPKASLDNSILSRGNSLTSSYSVRSEFKSVMDVLNFWKDDPEEILLDLGFGREEPDISVKIPSRFINNPSVAQGINIRLFLEAQKERMEVENADFSTRFRQLEVLHNVTSAFSSLFNNVSSSNEQCAPKSDVNRTDNRQAFSDKKKRSKLSSLLRRASKQALGQMQSRLESQNIPETEDGQKAFTRPKGIDKPLLKRRINPCFTESVSLGPLVEEQSPAPDGLSSKSNTGDANKENSQTDHFSSTTEMENSVVTEISRMRPRDSPCSMSSILMKRHATDNKAPDSFEMEEIHSFDEGGITENFPALARDDILVDVIKRANSCQSDSSGFLEEPSVPAIISQSVDMPEISEIPPLSSVMISQSMQSQGPLTISSSLVSSTPDPKKEMETIVDPEADAKITDENEDFPEMEHIRDETSAHSFPAESPIPDSSLPTLFKEDFSKTVVEHPDKGRSLMDTSLNENKDEQEVICNKTETIPQQLVNDNENNISNFKNSILHTESDIPVYLCSDEDMQNKNCYVNSQSEMMNILDNSPCPVQSEDGLSIESFTTKKIFKSASNEEAGEETHLRDSITAKEPLQASPSKSGLTRSVTVQMASELYFTQKSDLKTNLSKRYSLEYAEPFCHNKRQQFMKRTQSDMPEFYKEAGNQNGSVKQRKKVSTSKHSNDLYYSSVNLSDSMDFKRENRNVETFYSEQPSLCYHHHHYCHFCCHQSHCSSCCSQKGMPTLGAVGHLQTTLQLLQCVLRKIAVLPYTMEEMENMKKSLHTFRERLFEIEEQIIHEQAEVCNALSEIEREDVKHINDLRKSVRQEVTELEDQLGDLAHKYEEGLKMQLQRLLEEQSYLLKELHIKGEETHQSAANSVQTSGKSIAIQCHLLNGTPAENSCDLPDVKDPCSDIPAPETSQEESKATSRKSNPPEKLDFIGFLHSI